MKWLKGRLGKDDGDEAARWWDNKVRRFFNIVEYASYVYVLLKKLKVHNKVVDMGIHHGIRSIQTTNKTLCTKGLTNDISEGSVFVTTLTCV